MSSAKLVDVFGVARGIPLTYVKRTYVDNVFLSNLARDKHIVVYGGSKQGKTSLRKQCLKPEEYTVIQCGNTTTRAQIYEMLLKEAGAHTQVIDKVTVAGAKKVEVKLSAGGSVPFLGKAEGEGAGGYERTSGRETEKTQFEIDLSDPNDIIRVLKAIDFKKFVILEDFHYLNEEVQREIAFDLKAFHEKSNLVLIIVGVWLESNKLVLYNGDLAGRLVPVDADRWEDKDLAEVIAKGEALLKVRFTEEAKAALLAQCQKNVGVLQEACYRICDAAGVLSTMRKSVTIGTPEEVGQIVRKIGEEQAGRYQKFLEDFSEGLSKTELEMYRWIAYVLATSSAVELKRGLKLAHIFRRLNAVHPKRKGELLQNNVGQALQMVGKVQHKYHVKPIVLDYDHTQNELRVTDSGFILYVASQPRSALITHVGLSEAPDDPTLH